MFIDRIEELAFLNQLVTRRHPGPAQLLLLYGRRRVGKTSLLRHWIAESGLPATYWTAEKEVAALQRRKFVAQFEERPLRQAPLLDSWSEVWDLVADRLGDRRHIIVIDELPYAAESDSAMLSSLQHAWDRHFEQSNVILVLCGSQIRVMETLQYHQSPLFGRFTAQWHLQPLPFDSLSSFFPTWSIEERIALYSIVGGIPAYLKWLDPERSLVDNIRAVMLSPGSLFLAEPTFLLYDEVREPQTYLSVLKAIGRGNHTLDAISNDALIGKTHLSAYLSRLQDLKLVERRIPATVPPAKRRSSRKGRYHFDDPYYHFYFRFMAPYFDLIPDDIAPVLQKVRTELRAFVGQTGFEALCRTWVQQQRKAGKLPFQPTIIGSHWSRRVQIDVVAVDWEQRTILLGECKWGADAIGRTVLRELIEAKTPKLMTQLPNMGEGWQVHHAFFAREGFTPSAQAFAESVGMLLVDLPLLESGLIIAADSE